MMTGHVDNLHALIPVTFRLPGRPDITIEFVVDTGYLALPPSAINALGLPFEYDLPASLADDSEILVPVHIATIVWKDTDIEVRVLAMGRRPLLGTALLADSELVAQFAEHGLVTIDDI
jgi:clan AA aspartic protease